MEPGESRPTLLFRGIPVSLRFSAADRRVLRDFANDLAQQVGDGRLFTCVVTNDRELQRLNRDFLGHNYPTDVLSFPSGDAGLLGDLAISSERANQQAAEFGHSFLDEIRVLMLHGVLHLSGFDHETDRGRMASAEKRWRTHFELPRTLIQRHGVAR
jgi:probable rRNA maturation factor